MNIKKVDAIGSHTCDTCPFWHNPRGGPAGECIRFPATAFFIGMAPTSPLVKAGGIPKPGDFGPQSIALYPIMAPKSGCGEHPEWVKKRFS